MFKSHGYPRTKLNYVCNVFRQIIFLTLWPSCMAVWCFALLDKVLKPWVALLGGCGVSSRMYIRTHEAAPVGLASPLLKALGSSRIEVKWMPPQRPNGVISGYVIHRWGVRGSSWMLVIRGLQNRMHTPLCMGTEAHSCSREPFPVRAEVETGNSDTLPRTRAHCNCVAFGCDLFDGRDPRALGFYLCDSSKCCCLCFSCCPVFSLLLRVYVVLGIKTRVS